jgi:hypothetical protein
MCMQIAERVCVYLLLLSLFAGSTTHLTYACYRMMTLNQTANSALRWVMLMLFKRCDVQRCGILELHASDFYV